MTEELFFSQLAAANPERQMDAFLLDNFFGISPLIARELAFRTTGETDSRIFSMDDAGKWRFWEEIDQLQASVRNNNFTPISVWRDGKPLEFSCFPITQYGAAVESRTYPSFSALMDDFYESREHQERIRQRGADLVRTASGARDRLWRKLVMQEKDYAATQDRDTLRLSGELITANLYRMPTPTTTAAITCSRPGWAPLPTPRGSTRPLPPTPFWNRRFYTAATPARSFETSFCWLSPVCVSR